FSLYVMDYGAPVGYRLALRRPEQVQALIVQNGNAYDEGLREFWDPIKKYWADPRPENRAALHFLVEAKSTRWQYENGVADRRLPVTAQGAAVMSETQDIGIDALRQLALNLRWSWGRATDELWAQLDPELWALTHNPWAVLQTASPRRVQDLLARPEYRQRV